MTSSQINVQNYCTKRTWTSFMPLSLLFSWHNLLMETAKVVICNNFHAINKNWTISDDSIQILEEILEWFINAKHYLKSRTDFVKKRIQILGLHTFIRIQTVTISYWIVDYLLREEFHHFDYLLASSIYCKKKRKEKKIIQL